MSDQSTTVTKAVESRRSVRAFLDTAVDGELIRRILGSAARAPSGGNLQPWHIHYVDRRMGPPQWSDLGMYLQTVMLLPAAARGRAAQCRPGVLVAVPADHRRLSPGSGEADAVHRHVHRLPGRKRPGQRLARPPRPVEEFAAFHGICPPDPGIQAPGSVPRRR